MRSQLAGLLKEQQQLLELKLVQPTSAKVVQLATSAPQVRPNPQKNLLLGLLIGVALGMCVVFIVETFDRRSGRRTRLRNAWGRPC